MWVLKCQDSSSRGNYIIISLPYVYKGDQGLQFQRRGDSSLGFASWLSSVVASFP